MFIEALFTITQIWEQRKCPSSDEWIKKKKKKNGVSFSHEKEGKPVICDNMSGPWGHYAT